MSPVISRSLRVFALGALALACQEEDPLTGPSEPVDSPLSLAISDAANGGMPHFFLLPPLARQPAPTGGFDATLAPVVEICALGRSACAAIIATYTKERGPGGEVVRVDSRRELYQVNWRTRDFGLRDDVNYRILVRVAAVLLGYVDIDVERGGTELRILHTGEVIPLGTDGVLPVRFRAESGIPGRLAASPAQAKLEVGDRLQLQPLVYDLHGRLLSETFPLRWTTSSADIVEVDRNGVLFAKASGRATVGLSVGALNALVSVVEAFTRRIAFVSARSGDFHIYSMNGSGGDLQQLTTSGPINWLPDWSPNGARIVFERHTFGPTRQEIWVMNADGSGQTNLSNTNSEVLRDAWPAWSPDGSRIAFQRQFFDANQEDLFVMNADGSGKLNLSQDSGANDFDASWSPDGARIAFLKGTTPHVVMADGSNTPMALAPASSCGISTPAWSPSGHRIALTLDCEIWLVGPDGSGLTNLTNSTADEREPQWSPDGSKLYFVRDSETTSVASIWVMNADGSGQQEVVSTGVFGGGAQFDLTSDGIRLAYVQGDGNSFSTWEVFKINYDGTGKANLTNAAGKDIMPAWRP